MDIASILLFAADMDEIVRIVFRAALIIAPLIYFAFQAKGNGKNKPNAGKKPAPQRPNMNPNPAPQKKEEFRDEIEAFLKRAAENRGQPAQAQRPAAKRQPVRQPPPQERPAAPPRRVQPQRAQRPQPARPAQAAGPILAEAVPPAAESMWEEGVAEHVQHHIGGGGFAERASHLGEDVELSDERLETHLHSTFDHKIGQLDDSPMAAVDKLPADNRHVPSPQAAALVRMLKSPQGVQQAILIGELLKRPELD